MRSSKLAAWLSVVGFALGAPVFAGAAEGQPGKPQADAQALKGEPSGGKPVYRPPARGAPGGRVGGGARGIGDELVTMSALAPNHIGLTVTEQPVLHWYLSKTTARSLEFVLIEHEAIKPLIETRLAPPGQGGIQRIRLSDYGVRLSPGVLYRWFVALVPDPDQRSKDIIAGGIIERIEALQALSARLAQAPKADAPTIYAEAGIWYDAVAAISDLVDAAPADASLRNRRALLLEQVGLLEAAKYEVARAPAP